MAERLAIEGGAPVRRAMLSYARQTIDDDDIAAVVAALRGDWLTTGPRVAAFEKQLASAAGAAHAVGVSSGTAALHAAVFAAGIGPGDEVITSPMTFVASSNAILYLRGVPVFADILPDTLQIDPAAIEARLTPRTRAVLPVDFAGQPCDLDPIMALARARSLTVIEDAAHAFGAEYRGRPVGSIADLTAFSFHPAKLLTTGEGGAVSTSSDELAARLRRFRNHGFETDLHQRLASGGLYSPMVDLGLNYRLTDVQCALGAAQLGKVSGFLKRRAEIAERYTKDLAGVSGVQIPRVAPDVRHAWHIFTILLDLDRLAADRGAIVAALRAENVGATVHYVPAYWHPYYEKLGYRRGLCPRAEAAFERLVTLPLFPTMTDADTEDVVVAVRKVLGRYRR
jgi:dTDP-4-amino-4,6-dideoxygalactose transaminase